MKPLLLTFVLLFTFSCAARRSQRLFQVIPAQPSYVLQSPDLQKTPFPEIASRYTRLAGGWVDLRPDMGLRLEKAYFREGALKHDLANYIGTEVARYRAGASGRLRLVSAPLSLAERPKEQAPVQDLLSRSVANCRYHRFFYQVVFTARGNIRGAVLLGARSAQELERLGPQLLADPESICGDAGDRCAIFPEACTASVEIGITVNGQSRPVIWGSTLASVIFEQNLERRRVTGALTAPFNVQDVELQRLHAGRLTPVKIDTGDPAALRLVLLPGDSLNWR